MTRLIEICDHVYQIVQTLMPPHFAVGWPEIRNSGGWELTILLLSNCLATKKAYNSPEIPLQGIWSDFVISLS